MNKTGLPFAANTMLCVAAFGIVAAVIHVGHGGVDCITPATNKAVRANGVDALAG